MRDVYIPRRLVFRVCVVVCVCLGTSNPGVSHMMYYCKSSACWCWWCVNYSLYRL